MLFLAVGLIGSQYCAHTCQACAHTRSVTIRVHTHMHAHLFGILRSSIPHKTRACASACTHRWAFSPSLIGLFVKQRARIPCTVMCLWHITVPAAPPLPIGGLQGPLGTQSVLATPKGEPPCGLPLWNPHLYH